MSADDDLDTLARLAAIAGERAERGGIVCRPPRAPVAPVLSAEDSAALDRLSAHLAGLPGAFPPVVSCRPCDGGGWHAQAYGTRRTSSGLVTVHAAATAPTAGEALCDAAAAIGVAL